MSPLAGRALALAILFAAIGLVWLVVIGPVVDAFAQQSDDIALSQRLLAAYAGKIALRPVVEAEIRDLDQQLAARASLVGGQSGELAAANVQNALKLLIESEAGQVHSVQSLPSGTDGGLQRVQLQYEISLPMTRLKDTVYRIETGTPFLFLDAVQIQAPENWQITNVQMDPPNLDLRWTVYGYRAGGQP